MVEKERKEEMGSQEVVRKFVVTSLFMWALPLLLLYSFNHNIIPGASSLTPKSLTILSGCLAVLSVNVVIIVYIFLALKETSPASEPHPDPAFLSRAKASLLQEKDDTGASLTTEVEKKSN